MDRDNLLVLTIFFIRLLRSLVRDYQRLKMKFAPTQGLVISISRALYDYRLLTLKQEEWGDKVTVVSSDMRNWVAPEKVGDWDWS